MEKLIFENLKLKEHIQQLKSKKSGDDLEQVEHATKERDELALRIKSLEKDAIKLQEQLDSKDSEIIHLNDCNEKLASSIMNSISFMHEALNTSFMEPNNCNNLEEALEHYTMEISNQLINKDSHCQLFKKLATDLIAVVKALEQVLRHERVSVPRPPKVDEQNVVEYLKQLVYIMQGVCASKGRMVAREQLPPVVKREIATEEVSIVVAYLKYISN